MIRVNVKDLPERSLRGAANAIADRTQPNRLISIAYYGWTIRNFDRGGAMQTPPWQPLADSTKKQKARLGYSEKPLLRTGNLKNSFTPFYDARSGGVGARASYFNGKFDYATIHQDGGKHIPQRAMLPSIAYARETAITIYRKHVSDSIKKGKTQ